MMHMTFWWGDDLGDFFIQGLTVNTPGSMITLCITLFVLSIAVEGLKVITILFLLKSVLHSMSILGT